MSALRIGRPGHETKLILEMGPKLTARQEQILHIVRAYGGNRAHAARHLGVGLKVVQSSLKRSAAAGATIPPGGAYREAIKGRPRKEQRCDGLMARSGLPCGRPAGHGGFHTSESAWFARQPRSMFR